MDMFQKIKSKYQNKSGVSVSRNTQGKIYDPKTQRNVTSPAIFVNIVTEGFQNILESIEQ